MLIRIALLFFIVAHGFALRAQLPELSFQLGHNAAVTTIKTNKQFTRLFSASADGNVVVWDIGSAKQVRMFSWPGKIARDLHYNETDNTLLILFDFEIKVMDLFTGNQLHSIDFPYTNPLYRVEAAANNTLIVAGATEIYTCSEIGQPLVSFNYYKNSDTAHARNKIIHVIPAAINATPFRDVKEDEDPDVDTVLKGLNTTVSGMSVSDDGKSVVISVAFNQLSGLGGFYTLTTDSLKKINFTAYNKPGSFAFTDNNTHFYSTTVLKNAIYKKKLESLLHKSLLFYPASSNRNPIGSFAVNESYLCYGDASGMIAVCNTNNNTKKFMLKAHRFPVTSLCFSQDNNHLLSGDENGNIFLWDLRTGKFSGLFKGIARPINTIRYNDAGNLLFIGYADGEIKVWNILDNSFERLSMTSIKGKEFNWSILDISRIDSDTVIRFKCMGNTGKDYYIYNAKWNTSTNSVVLNEVSFNTGKKRLSGYDTCVTPEGDSIFSAGTRLKIISNGKVSEFSSGHMAAISKIAWNKNYRFYTTAGIDGLLKSRKINNQAELFTSGCLGNKGFFFVLPEGFYYVDKTSLKHLSFRIRDKIYPFEQFDVKFNRPDLVVKKFPFADSTLVINFERAYEKRKKRSVSNNGEINLTDDLPLLQILPAKNNSVEDGMYELPVKVKAMQSALTTLYIEVNGVPEPAYKIGPTMETELRFPIVLSEGNNKISAYVQNEKGILSLKEQIVVKNNQRSRKPYLYLITIGSGEFKDTAMNLSFAAKDANDITHYFGKDRHYSKIIAQNYTGKAVNKAMLREIEQTLSKATTRDMVMIFFAGHGLLDKNFNYYLSTWETDFNAPEKNALLYTDLENCIANCKARKKLLLIDACHSGEIDKETASVDKDGLKVVYGDVKFRGTMSLMESNKAFELSKILFADVDKSVGAAVISSSGGAEVSLEGKKWNNGVFTHVLLQGLKSKKADLNGDGSMNVSELLYYVNENVKLLTGGKQTPTSRVENIYYDFRVK